jgi:hypothetical protein
VVGPLRISCRDVSGQPLVESELSEEPEGGCQSLFAVPAFVLDVVKRRKSWWEAI